MRDSWIAHEANGKCPVAWNTDVEVRFRHGTQFRCQRPQKWDWNASKDGTDIVAYRIHEPCEQSEREDVPEAKPTKHPHYHKDVSHLSSIDVYRVLDLFGVTDQAIGHAAKKLLCAGQRGHKDLATDVQNVIDTLERWKEMWKEDEKNG